MTILGTVVEVPVSGLEEIQVLAHGSEAISLLLQLNFHVADDLFLHLKLSCSSTVSKVFFHHVPLKQGHRGTRSVAHGPLAQVMSEQDLTDDGQIIDRR